MGALQSKSTQPLAPFGEAEPDANLLVQPSLSISHSPLPIDDVEEPYMLALHFEIEDGWHVYWKNPGDSGGAPTWEFELPEGVTLGDAQWPTPSRYHPFPGSTNFIFEKELVVLFPLSFDERTSQALQQAGAGELVIRVQADWLVCKDICLAGSGVTELSIPFAIDLDRKVVADEQFETWISRMPKDDPNERGITLSFAGGSLKIHAPAAAEVMWFHEPSEQYFEPLDITNDGFAVGEALRVRYSERPEELTHVVGVVRAGYALPGGGREYRSYMVRVPIR